MTRKEALNTLIDMANELQLIPTTKQGEAFKMALRALQKQEQKTGHWIKTKEQDNAEPLILWRCSECLTVQRLKTNYCPNCGAKTEVEE